MSRPQRADPAKPGPPQRRLCLKSSMTRSNNSTSCGAAVSTPAPGESASLGNDRNLFRAAERRLSLICRQRNIRAPELQSLLRSLLSDSLARDGFHASFYCLRTWQAAEKLFRRLTSYKFGVRQQRRRFGFLSISASKDPRRRRRYALPAHSKYFALQSLRK
jgi:hypothetical protein